jgi:hypothetical protein
MKETFSLSWASTTTSLHNTTVGDNNFARIYLLLNMYYVLKLSLLMVMYGETTGGGERSEYY